MKKIIIGLVILSILVGAGYVFNSFKSKDALYVFVESGNVLTKPNASGNYKLLSDKKVAITTGFFVKTEVGQAHVLFPDNSVISIGENSEIEIAYTQQKISITQLIGDTYSRVQKLTTGDTYEVHTAGTIAAVRGTKFAVRYDPKTKKAKVAVTENTVNVSRTEATNITPTPVSPGMLANVDETINPSEVKQLVIVSQTKDDATLQSWINRNALLDEYLKTDTKTILENLIKTDVAGTDINSLRTRLEKSKPSTSESTGIKKTSLQSLLLMGSSQKCTYSYDASGVTSSATVYLSKGKMRTDSNMVINSKNIEYHMILNNDTAYVWGDTMPQGVKMSTANLSQPQAQQGIPNQSFDMNKEMNYSCSPWPLDESLFGLPSGIQFIDVSQMMKQAIPTTNSPSGANTPNVLQSQCAACTNLAEPTRTQCKTALGCK